MRTISAVLILIATIGIIGPAHAAGDAVAGKAKAALCGTCHGMNGEGKEATPTTPVSPALRGQLESYLIKTMQGFKSGERKEPTMNAMLQGMSEQDIENLAAYYAALK